MKHLQSFKKDGMEIILVENEEADYLSEKYGMLILLNAPTFPSFAECDHINTKIDITTEIFRIFENR
jgi:hypothetical protein